MADLGLEITTGSGLSSVTAVLRGERPGPVVLLRGDTDALPVAEESGEEFASVHAEAMHACGHDLHTGADRFREAAVGQAECTRGDVVFMFQLGEDGILAAAGRPVEAAYGLHLLSSQIGKGIFSARSGPLMAESGGLFVMVEGSGGHGSMPHSTRDPIPAACEMVTALQTMATRRYSAFEPVVADRGRDSRRCQAQRHSRRGVVFGNDSLFRFGHERTARRIRRETVSPTGRGP